MMRRTVPDASVPLPLLDPAAIRLVVSDLDGTLLDGAHRLGDYSRDVLRALRQRGLGLLLASGRHAQDVRHFAQVLGGDSWILASNGATVHDPQGRLDALWPLAPECLEFLLRDPRFGATHINVYRPDDWLVAVPEPRLLRYHQDSGFRYRVADFARLDATPVVKVFYYHPDPAQLRTLEDLILDRHGDRLDTTWSLPIVLEVMARGVSKGAALERVMSRLNLPAEAVIAFGDGRNDLELLRTAGTGVLMANADPRLKAALPHCAAIGSNADESVARTLARLFLE